MPFVVRQEVLKQLKLMLDGNVICPSKSPWASPVVLVRKRDGASRFCGFIGTLILSPCQAHIHCPELKTYLINLESLAISQPLICPLGFGKLGYIRTPWRRLLLQPPKNCLSSGSSCHLA